MTMRTFRGAQFMTAPTGRNDWEDEQEIRDRWWNPGPGELVLDIGAGIGSYTVPALACGARVVAFSPEEENTKELLATLALNPNLNSRCEVMRYGLYDRAGWMFYREGATRYDFTDEQPEGVMSSFPVMALDALATAPAWIKIDVEGAELDVLRGAEQTIRRHRPRMLVECHQFMDDKIAPAVTEYVFGLGLGYVSEWFLWHSVIHIFFEVKE